MTLVGSGNLKNLGKLGFEDFVFFRDFLCEKTGIKIRDNRIDYLEYRIQERMMVNNIADYREYYYMIKYDAGNKTELQELINLITVHETSFFRHPEQLDTLTNVVLGELIRKKESVSDRRLKIWSAACSTGEEPLTIAMIIRDKFPQLDDWNVSITATDISTKALAKAQTGIYNENSFRTPLEHIKNKYFKKNGGFYHVNNDLIKMISYRPVNLTDTESLNAYNGIDVILCRNVFIYFPDEVKEKISGKFYELLNKGGTLMLGNAEFIDVKKTHFRLSYHKGGPLYSKL